VGALVADDLSIHSYTGDVALLIWRSVYEDSFIHNRKRNLVGDFIGRH